MSPFTFASDPSLWPSIVHGLDSPGDAAMFWGAIASAILALLVIRRYPGLAAVAALVSLVGMAEALIDAPETAMFASIVMLLSVGLSLTGWTSWKLLTERTRRAGGQWPKM